MRPSGRLDNPAAYCGELIPDPSNLPTLTKTWWAEGQIKDRFHNKIIPDIQLLLRNADTGSAPFLWGLYMRGWEEKSASPYILISSHDKGTRKSIYSLLENSHIPKTYPEFGIYKKPMQPYELRPSAPLSGEAEVTSSSHSSRSRLDASQSMGADAVLSSSHDPLMGRRLFTTTAGDKPDRSATGGVVLRIGSRYYQKTVGHIEGQKCDLVQNYSRENFNYVFDDDSDDDDDDEDFMQMNYDATSRGSRTPTDQSNSPDDSGHEDFEADSSSKTAGPSNQSDDWQNAVKSLRNQALVLHPSASSHSVNSSNQPPKLDCVGSLQHNCRSTAKSSLDYALVLLDTPFDSSKMNQICINATTGTYIQIQGVGAVPGVERDIITVTASGGFTRGKLMPHAVYCYDHPKQSTLQKLFIVQLDTVVIDGDCGADVVDEETGLLYGHVVRGGRGTHCAYIVPADEVLEHLSEVFNMVPEIVTPNHTMVVFGDDRREGQNLLGKWTELVGTITDSNQLSPKSLDTISLAHNKQGHPWFVLDFTKYVPAPVKQIRLLGQPAGTPLGQLAGINVASSCNAPLVVSERGFSNYNSELSKSMQRKIDMEMKLFACPFYQHDPTMTSVSRACSGPGWPSIHRLKEHLNRVHRLPKYICPRCCDIMKDEKKLDEHLRSDPPCEKTYFTHLRGINDAQNKKLRERRKTTGTLTEEQKWLDIYMILFPEANQKALPSAYCSRSDLRLGNSAETAAQWKKMKKHIEVQLPSAVRKRVEERFTAAKLEVLHDLGDIIRDEVFQIFQGIHKDASEPFFVNFERPLETPIEDLFNTLSTPSYDPGEPSQTLQVHISRKENPWGFLSNRSYNLDKPPRRTKGCASDSGYGSVSEHESVSEHDSVY